MDATDVNQYLYDGEGRICAVASTPVPGMTAMTGYIYDAGGTRVAKGSITAWSCNPAANGFQTNSDYVLGPGGEQAAEVSMDANNSMAWQHTNVWAGGKLLATYDPDGLHFYLDDPLGTRRAQTDYAGVIEQTCQSLPFGDGLSCTGSITSPTEHHFTGKERDTESGNDYFEARYYSSNMGRFMSPDWSAQEEPVPYAKLDDPQTLNLYAYVGNNPMTRFDADGHGIQSCTGKQQGAGECHAGEISDQGTAKVDKDKVAETIDKNAIGTDTYHHNCAGKCHEALAAGGLGRDKDRPSDANKNGPWLMKHGAQVVAHSDNTDLPKGYSPQNGDVAVFSGGGPKHNPIGHMEIYDGKHKRWVSDTKQTTFSPGRTYGGSVTIYRFPN
jgi:RHS repeat-associated protein